MSADDNGQGQGGVLDLSEQEQAPLKVRLPDGGLYDMASAVQLSPRAYQQLISRYRRASELEVAEDVGPDELEEMMELLIDMGCIVLPDAPREAVGSLPYPKMKKLVESFFAASPAAKARGTGGASTTAS